MNSILQDWVMDLSIREQGTLLSAIRGCDLTPKINPHAAEFSERKLVAFLRFLVLHPADERELDFPGSFIQREPPIDWKASEFGHYPVHWYSHLMHAFEIIAYRHPNPEFKTKCYTVYIKLVHGLHLNIETKLAMIQRLTEDRIATNTVVS